MAPQTLEIAGDPAVSGDDRCSSSSRLNAEAPAFVPRAPGPLHPPMMKVHHHHYPHHHHHPPFPHPPPMATVVRVFHPPPVPHLVRPFFDPVVAEHRPGLEYYGGGAPAVFVEEQEADQTGGESDRDLGAMEGISDEVASKIRNQVEYYFSDLNLATTEHLMRFINRDPDGFVPMTVIASFKKIKILVHDISLLVSALRTSKKLVVSDDGKKVRREKPFTELNLEELQSRIVIAENLPEDHCYQNLMKIFSSYGNVKTIRTCYPQPNSGSNATANRSSKIEMLFAKKLHAFVEYETVEDAEKAVEELGGENNWRNRLKAQLLLKCLEKADPHQGRKVVHEGGREGDEFGEEDNVPVANQLNKKEGDNQLHEPSSSHVDEENHNYREGGGRHGKARGRGTRGRGRGRGRVQGQHHHSNFYSSTPPSSQTVHAEQNAIAMKQPPGPRMPDGTRGFTMGRGKSLPLLTANS